MSLPDGNMPRRHSADKDTADADFYAEDFEDNDACSSRQSRRSDGTGDFTFGSDRTSVSELTARLSSRNYNHADATGCRRMADLRCAGGDSNTNTAMPAESPVRNSPRPVFDNSSDDPGMWDLETLKARFLSCIREVQNLQMEAEAKRKKNKEEVARLRALGEDDIRRTEGKRAEIDRLIAAKVAYDTVINDELKKLQCETIRNIEEHNQKENLRKQRMRTVKKGTLVVKELQTLNIPADKCEQYKSACAALNAQKDRQKVLTEKIDWYERKLLDMQNKNENSRSDDDWRTSPDGASLDASPPLVALETVLRDLSHPRVEYRKSAAQAERCLPAIPPKAATRGKTRVGQIPCRKALEERHIQSTAPSGANGASLPELAGASGGHKVRERPSGRRRDGPGQTADNSRGKMLDITGMCHIINGDTESGRSPTHVIPVPPRKKMHYLPVLTIADEKEALSNNACPGSAPKVPQPPKGPKPKRRKKGDRRKH